MTLINWRKLWSEWSMNILNALSEVVVFYGCNYWYSKPRLMSAFWELEIGHNFESHLNVLILERDFI